MHIIKLSKYVNLSMTKVGLTEDVILAENEAVCQGIYFAIHTDLPT